MIEEQLEKKCESMFNGKWKLIHFFFSLMQRVLGRTEFLVEMFRVSRYIIEEIA